MNNTYYTIHQVSELLGISCDAIRLYEKEGLIVPKRNPNNGYRSYTVNDIHKIYGISLYRKIDISIPNIKNLLNIDNFTDICSELNSHIDNLKEELAVLQNKIKKQEYISSHLSRLNESLGKFSIKKLPGRYIIYDSKKTTIDYNDMRTILSSQYSSYGNFTATVQLTEDAKTYLADLSENPKIFK